MLAREAGIGALSQAVQEPGIESGRAELGLDAGFGRGATNIGQAALGAAGLAGLFRAGAWGLRTARGAREAPGAVPGERPALDSGGVQNNAPTDSAAGRLMPEDLAAAAHLAERDQMLDLAAVIKDPAGLADHHGRLESATAALNAGREVGERPATAADLLPTLEATGARISPQIERLSELQLGEIAGRRADFQAEAATARGALDLEAGKVAKREVTFQDTAASTDRLREQVDGLRRDVAENERKIREARPPTDPETEARLAAIDGELGAPALPARRRQALETERASITETLAATAPGDARLLASLEQERTGLSRATRRAEKALERATAARDKTAGEIAGRKADIAASQAEADAHLASNREITSNEMRRSVARLAAEGYGVRLTRDEAQAIADRVLGAGEKDMPATLAGVSDELAQLAQVARAEANEQVMTRLQGLARLNGRDLSKEAARAAAERLAKANPDESVALLAEIMGRDLRQVRVEDLPFPASEKAAAAAPEAKAPVAEGSAPAAAAAAAAPAPKPLGDPAIAREFERVIAETGDMEIHLGDRRMKVSEAMKLAETDAAAARELTDCIGVSA
jgi:hypothetical protein